MWMLLAASLSAQIVTVDLAADATTVAREERAVGAALSSRAALGDFALDLEGALGRDVPVIDAPAEGPMKLGVAAALTWTAGPLEPSLAFVIENGAPRADGSLAWSFTEDAALGVELEGLALTDPSVRLFASFEW